MQLDCTPEELAQFLGITRPAPAPFLGHQGDNLARIAELEALLAEREESYVSLDRLHASLIGELDRLTGQVQELQQENRLLLAARDAEPATAARVAEVGAYRGQRRMPTKVGAPGADVGDGLDIWRVDGSAIVNQMRRQAIASGTDPEEANRLSPYSEADYARLVARLEQLHADGHTANPVSDLAALLGRTRDSMRSPLQRAHELGIATPRLRQGQPGPQRLTAKGLELLGMVGEAPLAPERALA